MSTQKNVVATGSYFADQAQLMRERVLRKQTMRIEKAYCFPAVSMCLVKKDLEFADHLNRFNPIYSSFYLILQESPTLILLECGSWFRQCLPSTLQLRQ